jgi:hypothetical protein
MSNSVGASGAATWREEGGGGGAILLSDKCDRTLLSPCALEDQKRRSKSRTAISDPQPQKSSMGLNVTIILLATFFSHDTSTRRKIAMSTRNWMQLDKSPGTVS